MVRTKEGIAHVGEVRPAGTFNETYGIKAVPTPLEANIRNFDDWGG